MHTKLLYLEDMHLLQNSATIIDVYQEDNRTVIVLDQTIFYPQGGGQPYDTGTMQSGTNIFTVEEVRFVDGIVKHIGHCTQGSLAKGQTVSCSVDSERRMLHSKIHSAGHVVDMAVKALNLPLIPGKGFHFPQGPYVEYHSQLPMDKEQMKTAIEQLCNQFIQEGKKVTIQLVDNDTLHKLCSFVPENVPTNKPIRIVCFNDFCVPCGGTHVSDIKDIRQITIRKIKTEKDTIKIAYDVLR